MFDCRLGVPIGLHEAGVGVSNEIYVDREHGAVVVNDSGLPMGAVRAALWQQPEVAALVKWTRETRPQGGINTRHGMLSERDRYVTPENPYDQMRVAYEAARSDDVVGSVLDSTESLAFNRVVVECGDPDEEDIWNQIADDIDVNSRMREIWRETFITSNTYVAVWWGKKSYPVRGKTRGADGVDRARRKQYRDLMVPTGVSILDPLRILPVGGYLFGQERLCYIADWSERDVIDSWLLGGDSSGVDPMVRQLVIGRFNPDLRDRKEIGELGVDPNRLYLLNPEKVYRQTPTRSAYERFATVRMTSTFEILDLKHQLRQMDRAHLIGATNFIVLVKKGSKDRPAQQVEIDALQETMRTLNQVPVIVGDDRLSVEIITPKTDQTLNSERYAGLDIRISGRLYGMFITTKSRGDDSIKLARIVARGLEDKRDQQARRFLRYVFKPAYQRNPDFELEPKLEFYPKRIALDFDPALATYLLDLRDRGDLSRASVLSEIDYDEASEARKREYEAEHYDHIFQTQVPFNGGAAGGPAAGNPAPAVPPPASPQVPGRAGGRTGGNRNGGGRAPGSGQGQPPRSGRPAPPSNRARADLEIEPAPARPPTRRTAAHAAAARELAARRQQMEDAVDDALEDQASALRDAHEQKIDALRASFDETVAELEVAHEQELDAIRAELEGDQP